MAITSTTLSAAATATDNVFQVTSATGFTVGYDVWVDDERCRVQVITGTQIKVRRGLSGGSVPCAHQSGSLVRVGAQSDFAVLPSPRVYTYSAAGALTRAPGLHKVIGGSALAMTLADPSADMEGVEMQIFSTTAYAHTVTYTAGFHANTTSSDVATFAATYGNGMTIKVIDGKWTCLSNTGVTIA